jgi:hypothetical protein
MSYFVIGSRFDPGPPASFVRGGPPQMPGWTRLWDQALQFETADLAIAYLTVMAESRPAYLDKYGVFEVVPPNPMVLIWPPDATQP